MHPDHVLLTRLPLPPEQYKSAAQVQSFYRPLLARVKALPGVTDVAESSALPPYGGFSSEIEIPGQTHSEKWSALFQLCSEDYFALLRIKLLKGRVPARLLCTGAPWYTSGSVGGAAIRMIAAKTFEFTVCKLEEA
jgi:hypothetical protein